MSNITLHEAMQLVLKENDRPMTARELADEISKKRLYIQKDGDIVPTNQIIKRAQKKEYSELFDIIICLKDKTPKYFLGD